MPEMGDRHLTDFNAQLTERAYAHSFDCPAATKKIGPTPGPAPCAPTPIQQRPPWYCGPQWLTPENMAHVECYFYEAPGAWWPRLRRSLARWAPASGGLGLLILLGLFSPEPWSSIPASGGSDPHSRIGILNPAWVRQNANRGGDGDGRCGYFSLPTNAVQDMEPAKFVYVEPAEAQHCLEELIQMGLLTVGNGSGDVMKNLADLKALGIVAD
jgi:hypothetical protein